MAPQCKKGPIWHLCLKKGASAMPKKKRVCAVCGKRLKKEPCMQCDGEGTVRKFLFKTECPNCNGKGWIRRCPDAYDHLMARLSRSSTRPRPSTPQWKGTPKPKRDKPVMPPPARGPAHFPGAPPASPPVTLPAAPPASPPATPPVTPPIRRPATPPASPPVTLPAAPPASPPATPPVRPPVR